MGTEKHEYETSTRGSVELNSKFVTGAFSKNANKGNVPKASDIINLVKQNTVKKKEVNNYN